MKYVKTTVAPLVDENGKVFLTFPDFLIYYVDRSQVFTKDAKALRAGGRIFKVLEKLKTEDPGYAGFESEDYDLLLAEVRNPKMLQGFPEYPVMPARNLIPFIACLEDATEEPPEKEVPATVVEAEPAVAQPS